MFFFLQNYFSIFILNKGIYLFSNRFWFIKKKNESVPRILRLQPVRNEQRKHAYYQKTIHQLWKHPWLQVPRVQFKHQVTMCPLAQTHQSLHQRLRILRFPQAHQMPRGCWVFQAVHTAQWILRLPQEILSKRVLPLWILESFTTLRQRLRRARLSEIQRPRLRTICRLDLCLNVASF